MENKAKKVTLQVGDKTQEFEHSHAERILRHKPDNGGWQLPTNSEYELTKDGLTFRADKGAAKKS